MAKLVLLALAFATLVAFASAHRTIITTTVDDIDNQQWHPSTGMCTQQLQGEKLEDCRDYLRRRQIGPLDIILQRSLRQCCQELQNVDQECQCEAVQKALRQAQMQGGGFGSESIPQLTQKARQLPNQCGLQTRQCQIRTSENPQSRGSRQQCSEHVRQQSFDQCQSYLSPESGSYQQQQPFEDAEGCCQELQNVRDECQCEAMQEIYRQVQQGQFQGSQEKRGILRKRGDLMQKLQNLPNQCGLQVQQCRIPASAF